MNLDQLAKEVGGKLIGNKHLDVQGLASFEAAKENEAVVLMDKKYQTKLLKSRSKILITKEALDDFENQVIVANPREAFYHLMTLFYGDYYGFNFDNLENEPKRPVSEKIHSSCVIGHASKIGKNVRIAAHVVIGSNCIIGDNVTIFPNVTLYDHTVIGDNVIIHSGSVIGADGFGYHFSKGEWKKVPHIGKVIIGNRVEIGSNVSIDRGCLGNTVISNGAKIDNLVHIAHNCEIGSDTAIAAQVGTLGRAKIGNNVQIGGQSGVTDISIGDGAIVTARSGVTTDVKQGEIVSGFPARNHKSELKFQAFLRKLFQKKRNE